jgi:hypothetical protein
MFLRNVGNHLQDYTASQPPQPTSCTSLTTNTMYDGYRIRNTRFRFHIGFRKIVSAKVSYGERRTHASHGSPLLCLVAGAPRWTRRHALSVDHLAVHDGHSVMGVKCFRALFNSQPVTVETLPHFEVQKP